ncbi:MAG TPA: cupin domain-containing protein [bacterium]|nr:cupin domain-containing protein [bacterium]
MSALMSSYRTAVAFKPEHFNPVPVAQGDRVKVLLVCLEPGQFIPVHRPEVDLTIAVLEGEGTLALGDREEAIGPGTVAFAPAGTARGLRAATRLVALNVVTPPPTDADHAEVAAGLRRGRWR